MLLILAGLLLAVMLLQVVALSQGRVSELKDTVEDIQRDMAGLPVSLMEKQGALAESMTQRVNELNRMMLDSLKEVREAERQNTEKLSIDMGQVQQQTNERLEKVTLALGQNKEAMEASLNQRLHQQQVASEERLKGLTDSLETRLGRLTTTMEEKLADANKALRDGLKTQQDTNLEQMKIMLGQMNEHITKAQAEFGSKLEGTSSVVGQVHVSLGELAQQAKAMHELGRDIHSLQDVLMAPKLRGGLGETLLEEMLSSQLNRDSFEMQHHLADGAVVDAIVKIKDKKVPVDSKFPLESFKRLRAAESDAERLIARKEFEKAVKEHADSLARKYIRPDRNTYNFAMMYLPSEAIFYEVVGNAGRDGADLNAYLINQRVIPVSPNSFFAYLQCIVLGLRGFEIQKNAEEMLKGITQLQNQFEKFLGGFQKMGKHSRHLLNSYEDSWRTAEKLGRTMSAITHREMKVLDEVEGADAPLLEGSI